MRQACQRHLDDLVEGPKRGLVWRPDLAARVYQFFAALKLAEGEHAGQPFYLELWQCFIVGSLFGWLGPDGYRRFRVAYIEIGKGNGKTPLAAGIGLYMMIADGESGAEVYSAAVSRDQAAICFRDAKRFVEVNRALAQRIVVGERNLAHAQSGSFFRPLSAEGKTLDGKRVHCSLVDEVHEHDSATVVDKLRAGTKGRTQPLQLEITNSGASAHTVCFEHHEYSAAVIVSKPDDKDFNDSWFAYVCALDACEKHRDEGKLQPVDGCEDCDDWMDDPACWPKANPNLGVSITRKYLAEQVHEARGMPSKQNLVARLNFCIWTESLSAWIGREKWSAVQHKLDFAALSGRECYAGLDLSSVKDLTAAAFFFPDDDGEGGDAFVEFWTPEVGLAERDEKDKAPYVQWVREKHLNTTPGASVAYSFVAKRFADLRNEYQIRCLAYDRWGIKTFLRELVNVDVPAHDIEDKDAHPEAGDGVIWLRGFGQGFKDMNPAVKSLESMILNKRIRIHFNPVLSWNSASAVIEQDAAENRKFTKRKATGRIDGLVALTMAVGCYSMVLNGAKQMPVVEQGFVRL